MQALEAISKTREYLDYVERHINNVARAWQEVMAAMEKNGGYPIHYDDFRWQVMKAEVEHHDISKLSSSEFVQYRQKFYPTKNEAEATDKTEQKKAFDDAWEHHWKCNSHHWENWTRRINESSPYDAEIHCTHMVIDWLAMSYEFGDTPRSYYERNKERITLPEWAVKYINQIFDDLKK